MARVCAGAGRQVLGRQVGSEPFAHGAGVRGRRAAAAAHEPRPGLDRARGEVGEVVGARHVHVAAVHELRQAGVRHDRDGRPIRGRHQLLEHFERGLRADAAVDADHVGPREPQRLRDERGRVAVAGLAVGAEGHLRDDRHRSGERAHRAYRGEDLGQVLERLEHEHVQAALEQPLGLLAEGALGFGHRDRAERLEVAPERPHGAAHERARAGDLAGVAGHLHALAGDDARLRAQAVRIQAGGAGSERVGLDELGAGGEVLAVDGLDEDRVGDVQFVEAAFERDAALEEQRAHGAVGEERALGEPGEEGGGGHEGGNLRCASRPGKPRAAPVGPPAAPVTGPSGPRPPLLMCRAVNRTFLVAALATMLAGGASSAAVPVVPVMPVADVRPGQQATVRTVFAGDSIETFEAIILGVLPGGRADGDIILARATSPRVIASGVAQGMSGSPVYVDGRVVGALSSGWQFSKEPIFGITPIGEMLEVLDRPESARDDGTSGMTGVDPAQALPRLREYAWTDDPAAPAPPAPPAGRPGALALPLAAGGLVPEAMPVVRDLFAASGFTVTPGGRAKTPQAAEAARASLVPGAPVAVDVLRGDLNFSAIGTITYRDGDRVLLFGHPFFQSGEVRLPLSTAHIVGILPSLANSFKLGVPGTPVGTATQDRRAAVAGRLGAPPALLPFTVDVATAGRRQSFHFEVIEDRMLMPQLVATAAMNSLMESGGGALQQSVTWSIEMWRNGTMLRLGDRTAGESPVSDMLGALSSPLRFLAANPYERCRFDSLRIAVSAVPGRAQWSVRGARTLGAAVRPGGIALVSVELERWRGERRTVEVPVRVPDEFPDGRYSLWLGGGTEFDRAVAQRLPWRFRPVSLADAWRRLGTFHRSDSLYCGLWARAPEVSSDGEDYPELPNSALAVMASPEAAGDRARRADWALFEGPATPVDGVVRGEIVLDLVVDRKAP
jgi:hypothetical protein